MAGGGGCGHHEWVWMLKSVVENYFHFRFLVSSISMLNKSATASFVRRYDPCMVD